MDRRSWTRSRKAKNQADLPPRNAQKHHLINGNNFWIPRPTVYPSQVLLCWRLRLILGETRQHSCSSRCCVKTRDRNALIHACWLPKAELALSIASPSSASSLQQLELCPSEEGLKASLGNLANPRCKIYRFRLRGFSNTWPTPIII